MATKDVALQPPSPRALKAWRAQEAARRNEETKSGFPADLTVSDAEYCLECYRREHGRLVDLHRRHMAEFGESAHVIREAIGSAELRIAQLEVALIRGLPERREDSSAERRREIYQEMGVKA